MEALHLEAMLRLPQFAEGLAVLEDESDEEAAADGRGPARGGPPAPAAPGKRRGRGRAGAPAAHFAPVPPALRAEPLEAHAVRAPDDRFRCTVLHATMAARVCVMRQGAGIHPCRNCPLGAVVAAALPAGSVPESARKKTPAGRGAPPPFPALPPNAAPLPPAPGVKSSSRVDNLEKKTYGYLYVEYRVESDRHGNACWRCRCLFPDENNKPCGKLVDVIASSLKSKGPNRATSCGCAQGIPVGRRPPAPPT